MAVCWVDVLGDREVTLGPHQWLRGYLDCLSVVMEHVDSDHCLVELRVSGLDCLIVLYTRENTDILF